MSITDELRSWAEGDALRAGMSLRAAADQALAIADRIDAEHERLMQEQPFTVDMVPITDENMAKHGWIRLPVDADGEYIHIGDRMENNERVARIVLTDESWEPSVYLEKLPNVLHEYFCNEISHYHGPTVEDVLREFTDAILEWSGKSGTVAEVGTWSDVAAEYAAKFRLRGEDE